MVITTKNLIKHFIILCKINNFENVLVTYNENGFFFFCKMTLWLRHLLKVVFQRAVLVGQEIKGQSRCSYLKKYPVRSKAQLQNQMERMLSHIRYSFSLRNQVDVRNKTKFNESGIVSSIRGPFYSTFLSRQRVHQTPSGSTNALFSEY